MEIKRKYIIDERNRAVAVQLDIKTFEKIEEVLENYGLRLMQEKDADDEVLGLDQAQLSPDTRSNIEKFAFDELPRAGSVAEVGRIERMKGYRGFYKARFGSYRVDMKIEQDALIFEVVMDRKDIYTCFP